MYILRYKDKESGNFVAIVRYQDMVRGCRGVNKREVMRIALGLSRQLLEVAR